MRSSKGIYSSREWLHEHYVVQRLSLRTIAGLCQVDFKTIHYWVRQFDLPRHAIGSSDMRGSSHPRWNGGKTRSSSYIVRLIHGKVYIGEHRIVAATVLKRALRKGEVVHHINLIPSDNRPENLYVFSSQSEHKAYHQALKYGHAKPLKSNLQ